MSSIYHTISESHARGGHVGIHETSEVRALKPTTLWGLFSMSKITRIHRASTLECNTLPAHSVGLTLIIARVLLTQSSSPEVSSSTFSSVVRDNLLPSEQFLVFSLVTLSQRPGPLKTVRIFIVTATFSPLCAARNLYARPEQSSWAASSSRDHFLFHTGPKHQSMSRPRPPSQISKAPKISSHFTKTSSAVIRSTDSDASKHPRSCSCQPGSIV